MVNKGMCRCICIVRFASFLKWSGKKNFKHLFCYSFVFHPNGLNCCWWSNENRRTHDQKRKKKLFFSNNNKKKAMVKMFYCFIYVGFCSGFFVQRTFARVLNTMLNILYICPFACLLISICTRFITVVN